MDNQLHQRPAAEQGHRLHRYTVGAHDDRGIAYAATDHGIARTDLLRHVDAAAGALKGHIEAFRLVISLGLSQHPGTKGRQEGRRRQQISHILRRGIVGQRTGGQNGQPGQ